MLSSSRRWSILGYLSGVTLSSQDLDDSSCRKFLQGGIARCWSSSEAAAAYNFPGYFLGCSFMSPGISLCCRGCNAACCCSRGYVGQEGLRDLFCVRLNGGWFAGILGDLYIGEWDLWLCRGLESWWRTTSDHHHRGWSCRTLFLEWFLQGGRGEVPGLGCSFSN